MGRGSERAEVVVVGGGLAGIAAAARLKERGVQALLVEAEPALGGKLRALTTEGTTVPRGPMVWEARRQSVTRLVQLLDLGGDIVPAAPGARARYVVRGGALCALEPSPLSVLTTPALSLGGRLDLLREPLRAQAARSPGADESVASFFTRRFGADVAEGLLYAMINGIWAGDPERLSAAVCFPDMVSAEREHGSVLLGTVKRRLRAAPGAGAKGSLALRGGLWRIGARAQELLPVRLGVRIDALDLRADGVTVRGRAINNDSVIIEAKAAVLAAEAPGTRALLQKALRAPERAAVDALLAEVVYAPLAVVHWRERRPGSARIPAGFGWLSPPRERCFSLGTLFVTDLLGSPLPGSARGDGGRRQFATFVGGALAPERARLTDDELRQHLAAELLQLTGGELGEVLHVERARHAVAQPTLGHAARIARLEGLFAEGPLALAGSWLGAGAMKDAVESGSRAADDVIARLARPGFASAGRSSSARAEQASLASKKTGTPLAVVGASYRDVSTEVRARLAAAERSDDAPSKQLVEAGYADSVVFLETCSRVEWIVSSPGPGWAAEILKSTLAKRVPDARLHTKTGHAGAHYLLRVAMGLDSVAEGEPAVGRQLVLAFEREHKAGNADRALRVAWRAVQQLLGERRRRGVVRHGLGVQTLVVEELAARGVTDDVAVLGLGEIGRAVTSALKESGYAQVDAHRRATMADFLTSAPRARAVIVCTGGPEPWLELPSVDGALVIDIGVPVQVRAAPGWTHVTLEDLLARPRRLLDDETRAWLVDQVGVSADRLSKELADPAPANALLVIDEARRVFLRETLPPLLDKLPQASAEELRRACTAFAHQLMERVRDGGVV